MTDHLRAYRVLLNALSTTNPGRVVTVDDFRLELGAAQANHFEMGEVFRSACRHGYLADTGRSKPSTHPPAKGRRVQRYRRTEKAVPEHPCAVQGGE